MRTAQRVLMALFASAMLPADISAQQAPGVIAGRVLADDGAPLQGARVTIPGTSLRAVANETGGFRVPNVPAGPQAVTVTMIGYSPRTERTAVASGETVTLSVVLRRAAIQLGAVVVSGTGREQNQREIGSSVGIVNTADVQLAPVASTTQLLQGRVSGVVVTQSSGMTGGGSRVRIRGNNSISLSNAPLIIIDGVRAENAETGSAGLGFGVGGQTPSRLNDLNPNDIETIEVLKGPAAAALYGTAAANGVLQVVTKSGRSGRAETRAWAESGRMDQQVEFPDNVQAVGTLLTAAGPIAVGRCDFMRLAIGANPTGNQVGCTGVTQVHTYNPLEAGGEQFFKAGDRQALGASVSGGGEGTTLYLSTNYDNEHGVQPMNTQQRIKVQANTASRLSERLNVGANVSYLDSRAEFPESDNALFGLVPMALFGDPSPANVAAAQGFDSDPAFFSDWKTYQNFTRVNAAVRGEYRPLTWLSFNGNAGVDRYAREDRNHIPRTNIYGSTFGGVYEHGYIQSLTYNIANLTTNASGTALFNLTSGLISTTSLGTQYVRENQHTIYAFGAGLTPGIETSLAGATSNFNADETNVPNATLAAYGQQQLAWRDRVFLNAALRADKNTAFGQDIGWILYPSVSASWVLSEESFFPKAAFLTSLRVRAAYGQAGLRPGPSDAAQAFASQVTSVARSDVAAITFNTIGNPDLNPERISEYELGLESQLFNDRLGFELNFYHKTSQDALVSKPMPPSLGSSGNRYENLGQVDNSGLEYRINLTPVRTASIEWNANLAGSFTRNRLTSLGVDAQGNPNTPVIHGFGSTQRHAEGHALGSYFHFPITTYADANGDGLLSPSEVTVRRDTVVFLGNPFPRRELSVNSDLRLGKHARLSGMLDYKGGFQLLNSTEAWRCSTVDAANCAALYDRNTSIERQAAMVAKSSYGSYAGWVETADFLKLREIALTLSLPSRLSSRVNASALSVTFAGRNLKTWTPYSGLDPELNYSGQINFTTADFGSLPPNRMFQVRLDVTL